MWYLDLIQQVEDETSPEGHQPWEPVRQRLPGLRLWRRAYPGSEYEYEELRSVEQCAHEGAVDLIDAAEEKWWISADGPPCLLEIDDMKPLLFRMPWRQVSTGDTRASRACVEEPVQHMRADYDQAL